jgi:hypothetical protein
LPNLSVFRLSDQTQKSPLAHLAPAGSFLILASWPLSLAGTVRRHARHVMMVMTMMVGADLHIY